jgi:carboxymethylenebutenolidase
MLSVRVEVALVEEDVRVWVANAHRGRPLIGTITCRHEAHGPAPGVLLLHEVGGVNRSLRAIARAFAVEGYVVFTPDMYLGVQRPLVLARLITGVALNPLRNQPLAELRAAMCALGARPDVDAARMGVIGYSMGAAYALQLACVEASVRVAAVFCGQAPRPLAALRHACPVVGSYAGRDFTCRGIPARLERALTQYGIEHDLKTYHAAAHAFYDPWGPMYDEVAARDAWERTLKFMRDRLSRQ